MCRETNFSFNLWGSWTLKITISCKSILPGSKQSFAFEEVLAWALGVVFVCDAAKSNFCSESNNGGYRRSQCRCCYTISFIRTWEYFLIESAKNDTEGFPCDVLDLLPTGPCKTLIYQVLIGFTERIVEFRHKGLTDGLCSPLQVFFQRTCPFPNIFRRNPPRWLCVTNHQTQSLPRTATDLVDVTPALVTERPAEVN